MKKQINALFAFLWHLPKHTKVSYLVTGLCVFCLSMLTLPAYAAVCEKSNNNVVTTYYLTVTSFNVDYDNQRTKNLATGTDSIERQIVYLEFLVVIIDGGIIGTVNEVTRIISQELAKSESAIRREIETTLEADARREFPHDIDVRVRDIRVTTGGPPAGYRRARTLDIGSGARATIYAKYDETTHRVSGRTDVVVNANFNLSGEGFVNGESLLLQVRPQGDIRPLAMDALTTAKRVHERNFKVELRNALQTVGHNLIGPHLLNQSELETLCYGEGGAITKRLPFTLLGKRYTLPVQITATRETILSRPLGEDNPF